MQPTGRDSELVWSDDYDEMLNSHGLAHHEQLAAVDLALEVAGALRLGDRLVVVVPDGDRFQSSPQFNSFLESMVRLGKVSVLWGSSVDNARYNINSMVMANRSVFYVRPGVGQSINDDAARLSDTPLQHRPSMRYREGQGVYSAGGVGRFVWAAHLMATGEEVL
jgi:hypothetical protein